MLPPLRLLFALKERNAGKLDSHSWFFNGFVEYVYALSHSPQQFPFLGNLILLTLRAYLRQNNNDIKEL